MDVGARRFLWNCVRQIVKQQRTVILTTHSMEECEALCTKMAIMVNRRNFRVYYFPTKLTLCHPHLLKVDGQFKCYGSTQHLKNRFGSGYSMTLRLREGGLIEDLKMLVSAQFPDSNLVEEHTNQLTYHLPLSEDSVLPKVFRVLQSERERPDSNLETFTMSQLTLDDVSLKCSNHSKWGN